MSRDFKRSDRVADLVQREVGSLLVQGLKDPRLELVTITGVKVSGDLRHATVYFAVHGGEDRQAEAQRGLTSAAGFLRSHLCKVTSLRIVPELHFKYDTSLDTGERIDKLLREVRGSDEGQS